MQIDLKIGQWEYQGYEPPEEYEPDDVEEIQQQKKVKRAHNKRH